jgi:hypothetical protein
MILDESLEFSDAQAVTSTAISTNVVDNGATPTTRDLGNGDPLYLVVQTNTTCTDSGSDATLTVTLESDSTADLATSATTHFSTGALAFAAFKDAGTVLACVALPHGNYERYMGVRYTVASGPLTAGAFDAFITANPQKWQAYPDALSAIP